MTPERAAGMADRMGLSLTERELAGVADIINETGNLAPEPEVVGPGFWTEGSLQGC